MKKERNTKEIMIVAPPSLFEKFKLICAENYKTVSEVLRDAMQEYIKQNEKRK